MATDARHRAAAAGARAAQQDPLVGSGDPPPPRRGVQRALIVSERPTQVAVEDVACGHLQGMLQVPGGRRLDAGPALRIGADYILNRFGQNGIQRCQYQLGQLVA
ncbi:hypothetical protein LRC484719_15340 [Mycobacterium riyadhense]